ncbi:hypothetical protein FF124_06255 [Martelella lutilitoris]|uniref:Uncharacterized protein n=1 Tax=Martelella lutilitoris TaxID=2583532 RepID=A0A5C4JTG5_9HYPH|nr:hypothetical protein [Martelella lutilitoris]TNB48725.1 hypothetical protein FF124_06255 [Martelella lutilitoris]
MIPLLSQAAVAFSFAAFFYFIVSYQVTVGFPPFYVPFGSKDVISLNRAVSFVFAMMFAMALYATTKFTIFSFAFGCIALAGGIDARGRMKKKVAEIGLPQWMWIRLTLKWPMLVFDVWTIAASCYVFWVLFQK